MIICVNRTMQKSYHTLPVKVPDMFKLKYRLAGILLFTASTASADEVSHTSFDATYKLYSKGMEVAVIQRTFTKANNNEYIYRSESKPTGFLSLFRNDHIVEESRWKFVNQKFYPLDYSYLHTGGRKDRDVDIHFDWDNNLIINKVNDHTWRMPLEAGVLDKLLYQYAIMHDLQNGYFPESYTIADGGKMKTYYFERLGTETVHTPLGELETIKILRQKPNDERKSFFWCASALQYLPVKVKHIEDDGLTTIAIIESLKGFD